MFGSIYINRVRTHDLKQMILNQANNEDIKESIDKVRKGTITLASLTEFLTKSVFMNRLFILNNFFANRNG